MPPIFEEIIKSYNKNIKVINYCNLEGDLYLFATKNEHVLRNKNEVTFVEEFLLDKTIQFLLFDYKSYTIKEIKPVIYPITMNLSKEDENDGFQLVALRNLFVNKRGDINGGITNENLYRQYLEFNYKASGYENYKFTKKNLKFPKNIDCVKFTMASYSEFCKTNRDFFTVQLTFNQNRCLEGFANPYFISLYFKVKDSCCGLTVDKLFADINIQF